MLQEQRYFYFFMMPKKPKLFLEDAIFDEAVKQQDVGYAELFLSNKAFFIAALAAFLIGVVVAWRLVYLNIVDSDLYKARAFGNAHKEIIIPAKRGIISDRFGVPLVKNEPSLNVFINVAELIRDKNLDFALQQLASILDIDKETLLNRVVEHDLQSQNIVVVDQGITNEQAIAIMSANIPGVEVSDGFVRVYENGPAFAHVVGYDGYVRAGLEKYYDKYLRGEDGSVVKIRDSVGKTHGEKYLKEPKPGLQVVTTIDGEFQKYFYQRMRSSLFALGLNSGAGIAMDPRSGEILALLSFPSFDNSIFAASGNLQQKTRLLNSPNHPLFNRAIAGLYNPGSTIKPLVAVAALKEGVVDKSTQINSRGFIEVPNPYFPDKPSRFVDWKPHGWVDIYSALARSSNIYFYAAGGGLPRGERAEILRGRLSLSGLGINKLNEYWREFLLDQKTGIDLPGEAVAPLPSPQLKENRTGEPWRVGDTYNVSIGQGDLLITPIQLLNMISAIANGGILYKPFIVQKIKDEQGNVLQSFKPKVLKDLSSRLSSEIKEVQKGMKDAVQKWYGTAFLLADLPFSSAGKTGSAQTAGNTQTNAFFVGYAPADDPKIAVLVLVENARHGSLNAVPIAKDVLRWYYVNRLQPLQ